MSEETFRFRAFTRLAQLQHLLESGRLDDQFYFTGEPAAA